MSRVITEQEYLAAKKIIEEYEHDERQDAYRRIEDEDDDGRYDDEEDAEEREDEERLMAAYECTCGSWTIANDGRAYRVADCCCGRG